MRKRAPHGVPTGAAPGPSPSPKVVFIYFSFTHQTERVARAMADALGSQGYDVTLAPIEFTDAHYGARFSQLPMQWPIAKIVGMLPAQFRKETGTIKIPPAAQASDYDLVVLGAPTWWLTTCMPMRSYLQDPALHQVVGDKPFAVFSTSRRYYRYNLKTMRQLGKHAGGRFVDGTHFVADGNQVMSMWSWLLFMRHNAERRRSFGVALPKPNLKVDFEQQAVDFITAVAKRTLAPAAPKAADAP